MIIFSFLHLWVHDYPFKSNISNQFHLLKTWCQQIRKGSNNRKIYKTIIQIASVAYTGKTVISSETTAMLQQVQLSILNVQRERFQTLRLRKINKSMSEKQDADIFFFRNNGHIWVTIRSKERKNSHGHESNVTPRVLEEAYKWLVRNSIPVLFITNCNQTQNTVQAFVWPPYTGMQNLPMYNLHTKHIAIRCYSAHIHHF